MSEAEFFNDSDEAEILGGNDEQLDALASFDMASLRKVAKIFGVTAQRTWSKEDYLTAIKRKQEQNTVTNFVFDSTTAPKPGYARVIIHRDPTPGHQNSPVHYGFNGMLIAIPRGVEVDVPYPFVDVMKNAITVQTEMVENLDMNSPGTGRFRDEDRLSYPFQVLAATPGEWNNQHDGRKHGYAQRKAFFDTFGHWPTHGELTEWKKQSITDAARSK